MNPNFVDKEQKMFWDAFSGKCGEEFRGNPVLMQLFIEKEMERNKPKEDEGRSL